VIFEYAIKRRVFGVINYKDIAAGGSCIIPDVQEASLVRFQARRIRITLHIGAGQEINRRITEEELPAHQDEEETIDTLTQAQHILAGKIINLEKSRAACVRDTTLLGNQMKTIDDNDQAIESILTEEMPNHMATLAMQKMTADTLRLTSVVEEFRQKTRNDVKDAIKATQTASKLAAANRSDSPEQLKAALDSMERTKKLLEKAVRALPQAEEQKTVLRGKLIAATSQVVDAQVDYARQAAAANGNRLPSACAPKMISKP
jgi:hypothetical protein